MKASVTSTSLRVARAACSVLGVLSNFLADGVSYGVPISVFPLW